MLYDLFTDKIFILENEDKKPCTVISETDSGVIAQYNIAKNFILYASDKPELHLFAGGHYALIITRDMIDSCNKTFFSFTLDSFDIEEISEGKLVIGPDGTVCSFSKYVKDTIDDRKKEIDCSDINIANRVSVINESKCDNRTDDHPIELSSNSFTVDENTIGVDCPELKIATVDKSTFNIDEDRQKAQDKFLKNLSRKISKANHL